MSTSVLTLLPELVELLLFSLGSLGLSVAGVYIERFALSTLQTGDPVTAAWAGVIGGVALVVAYFLATDKVAGKLTDIRRAINESAE